MLSAIMEVWMLRIQKAPPNLTTEGHTRTSSPEYKISHILYIKKGSWFPLPPESSQENGNNATRYIQVLFVSWQERYQLWHLDFVGIFIRLYIILDPQCGTSGVLVFCILVHLYGLLTKWNAVCFIDAFPAVTRQNIWKGSISDAFQSVTECITRA